MVDVWVIASARVAGLKKEEQERQKERVCCVRVWAGSSFVAVHVTLIGKIV